MKEIKSLYLLKFVCAFFVVCIHILFFGRELIVPLIKIAVPCFFLVSGFFLVDDEGYFKLSSIKKQLKKLLWLTIFTNIIYAIVLFVFDRTAFDNTLNFQSLFRLLTYGDIYAEQLWFMTAYMEVLLILFIIMKFKRNCSISTSIIPLVVILLLTAVLLGRYSTCFGKNFSFFWCRNALNVALPFIFLGCLIRKEKKFLNTMSNKWETFLLLALVMFSYLEYLLQYKFSSYFSSGDLNLLTIPLSLAVFVFFVRRPNLDYFKLSFCGKSFSTDIYLYHAMFLYIGWKICPALMTLGVVTPILVTLICIILSIGCNKIKLSLAKFF